jgi:alpha-tubulin suppressor-like RCC1 family protein
LFNDPTEADVAARRVRLDLVSELEGIRIVKVSIGLWHATVLSDQGDVYEWGWLQAGHVMSTFPNLIDAFDVDNDRIADIACGSEHTVAMTRDGWCGKSSAFSELAIPISSINQSINQSIICFLLEQGECLLGVETHSIKSKVYPDLRIWYNKRTRKKKSRGNLGN